MFRLAVELVFFRVTVWMALAVPASRLPKSRLAGVNDTAGVAAPEPTPVSPTGCAAKIASEDTLMAPEMEPLTVGWKLTLMVQLAPAASEAGQLLAWE
jgi:hypothetical protein